MAKSAISEINTLDSIYPEQQTKAEGERTKAEGEQAKAEGVLIFLSSGQWPYKKNKLGHRVFEASINGEKTEILLDQQTRVSLEIHEVLKPYMDKLAGIYHEQD
jgi:hypothetical protein